jgi:hypothetical protein
MAEQDAVDPRPGRYDLTLHPVTELPTDLEGLNLVSERAEKLGQIEVLRPLVGGLGNIVSTFDSKPYDLLKERFGGDEKRLAEIRETEEQAHREGLKNIKALHEELLKAMKLLSSNDVGPLVFQETGVAAHLEVHKNNQEDLESKE